MNQRWISLIVIGLLAIIIGVPIAFQKSQALSVSLENHASNGTPLVIISPHTESIRFEIGEAFNRYRHEKGESSVLMDWRSSGGTSDLRKQVLAELEAAAGREKENDGLGYDLFFGGGDIELNRLASGISIERNGKAQKISALQPIVFPEGFLNEVYPEAKIAGEPLYHKDLLWAGVVLSGFGIVYNRDLLKLHELPEPKTWDDLTDPKYFNELALADPAHSGSVAACYHAPLRRMGWTKGWAVLRRMLANGRYITAAGSKPSVDVSAGEAAAGLTIDFYGRFQAGAVGGDRLGYVEPKFMTAINADPIGILRGAPHKELANEFVLWLLSKDAQALWQRKLGTTKGPVQFELRRMPIRRDLYEPEEMKNWVDQVNPYDTAKAFPEATPIYFPAIAPIMHAMAIDVHDELKAAWQAMQNYKVGQYSSNEEAFKSPRFWKLQQMHELFDEMPEDLKCEPERIDYSGNQWNTPAGIESARMRVALQTTLFLDGLSKKTGGWKGQQLLEARMRWTAFFRENYRRIVAMSKE